MIYLLWILSLLVVATYLTGPLIDPDLWWHLTVGRWMFHNLEIPTTELWNRFALGKPWIAYSWSNEILFYAAEYLGGTYGLLLLKIGILTALAISLGYCYGVIARDWMFGVFMAFVALAGCANHATLRPQTITWIFLIWLIYSVHRIELEGVKRKHLMRIALLMLLWANTHITTALALGVIGAWALSGLQLKRAFQVVGTGFLATLFTPYSGAEWVTFLSKTTHPLAYQAIAEFQPATIMFFPTGFLLIGASLLGVFLVQRRDSLSAEKLLLAIGFVIASLAFVKFMPMATIVILALVCELWGKGAEDRVKRYGNLAEGIERLKRVITKIPREGLAFVCLCLIAVNCVKLWKGPVDLTFLPKHAVDFIIEQELPHPVTNDFGHGGYLMYRFAAPDGSIAHPVAIDGRTNVTPPEIMKKFLHTLRGLVDWHEYLTATEPKTILWKLESPLSSILIESPDWCEVFRKGEIDSGHIVFVSAPEYYSRFSHLASPDCPQKEDEQSVVNNNGTDDI